MVDLPHTETLELELAGGWLTIWFNRPESRNALSDALRDDLLAVLACVRDERAVRGITLRGRGGIFCAGGDLKQFQSGSQAKASAEEVRRLSRDGASLFDAINTAPQVVVAVIEGGATAGGFGMACCADVVICEKSARFAMTETMIGLSPAQIAPFVIARLGYATARRLMLTGARFDAVEAAAFGFADSLCEGAGGLDAQEAQVRKQVLACAPGAIADTKALILALPGMARGDVIELAADNFACRMLSDEAQEGIASFVEKRKPAWVPVPGEGQ